MWIGYLAIAYCLWGSATNALSSVPVATLNERQAGTAGSLRLDSGRTLFTFDYSTPQPHEKNWIGLYNASGGGPVDQKYVSPSLVWKYAPVSQGSVQLNVESFSPGEYRAFFLARDGYEWLAEPLNVTLKTQPSKIRFPVANATLHNARRADSYSATVAGFIIGQGSEKVTFQKTGGASWIQVKPDGSLSGTPDASAPSSSSATIRASAASGSTAEIRLNIPVRASDERLLSDLRVMTFNLWHGGTRVNNYHEKQLRFITETIADIVTFQEATGGHATRLGNALGWFSYQSSGSVGVISRYPIIQRHEPISAAGGVRIDLNGGRTSDPVDLNVWSAHLGYTPYGPYDFCFDKMTKAQVLDREAQSDRTPQITAILNGLDSQLKASSRTPVILAGDFNAPSHLDWIPALQTKNCGIDSFDWPTSIIPTQRGLIDSFRVANPDPVKVQATTWSPVFPKHDGATGRDEPQDRIDFIYHTKDRLTVVGSQVLVRGSPAASPGHEDNEWTSDHRAVMTQYRVQ